MNQSFPCRYGSKLQGKKIQYFFESFLGVLIAAWMTKKNA
jgi:hypothetical protein